jgi:WD40 repeat protein
VSGRQIRSLVYKRGILADCLALSPDGKRTISADAFNQMEVRDVQSGATRTLSNRLGWPCALSPDGNTLAAVESTSFGSTVVLWDLARDRLLHRLARPGSVDRNLTLAFSPDGKILATAGDDTRLHLWDVASGRSCFEVPGHQGSVHRLAFTADGKQLVSSGLDGTVRTWDLATQQQRAVVTSQEPYGQRLCISDDAHVYQCRQAEDQLLFEDLRQPRPARPVPFSGRGMPQFLLLNDDQLLTYEDQENCLRWYDLAGGQCRGSFPLGKRSRIGLESALILPNGTLAVLLQEGSPPARLVVWDTATAQCLGDRPAATGANPPQVRGQFLPGGRTWLAIEPGKNRWSLWETSTGERRLDLNCLLTRDWPPALGTSADGRWVALGGADPSGGAVHIWDTATGEEVCHLNRLAARVSAVGFSPDGRILATGFASGDLLLWDLTALVADGKQQAGARISH